MSFFIRTDRLGSLTSSIFGSKRTTSWAAIAGACSALLLSGCPEPVPLVVQLWTPKGDAALRDIAGFNISVIINGQLSEPVRLSRGSDDLSSEVEGLTVPETGLDVDSLLLEAIDSSADRTAVGRTGPTKLMPDGTTTTENLTSVLFPEGVHALIENVPAGRSDAAICDGGFGRAYVLGGANPTTGALLDTGARIDPAVREAVEVNGGDPRVGASCATLAAATSDDSDVIWLAGGCDANGNAFGLEQSSDGESFSVVDATALECSTSSSIFGEKLWILAGERLQLRDATTGELVAERTLDPPRYGGEILATADGAIIGGGYLDADRTNFSLVPLTFATGDGSAINVSDFGPDGVRIVSFTMRDDGEAFALVLTQNETQIRRLQPGIGSAPVQVEAGSISGGEFFPNLILATAEESFVVLNDTGSTLREVNDDGSTKDFEAGALGARLSLDDAGAVRVLGGRANGVKAYVRQLE